MTDRDLRIVQAAERRLLDPAVRSDAAQLDELLDAEFMEIGSSGRIWQRSEIIAELTAAPDLNGVTTSDLTARHVTANVIVATYSTSGPSGNNLRSSWWRSTDAGWRCILHQGTPLHDA